MLARASKAALPNKRLSFPEGIGSFTPHKTFPYSSEITFLKYPTAPKSPSGNTLAIQQVGCHTN